MPLLTIVLVLVAVGVLLGLVNKFGAEYIAAPMLKLINVVVPIACVVWLLGLFGLWHYLQTVTVGS